MLFPMLEQAFREGLQVVYATINESMCAMRFITIAASFPSGMILLRHSQGKNGETSIASWLPLISSCILS